MLFLAASLEYTCFPHQIVGRQRCGTPDKCVRGKQADKGLNLPFISICDDTSSFRGRTGSLDLFIRRHAKTLLMTTVHSEPYIKHMYGNQRKLITQICRDGYRPHLTPSISDSFCTCRRSWLNPFLVLLGFTELNLWMIYIKSLLL